MIDFLTFNTLLLAGKWVFIGLIYLVMLLVVVAVRREMSLRLGGGAAPQAAPGKLRVIEPGNDPGVQSGMVLPLELDNHLGAASDNDLILSDSYISAHHARLQWDGASWWLEDLASKNGTSVDGRPCVPFIPQELPPGGRLQLGDMIFELVE
jgi:hypothetical protein